MRKLIKITLLTLIPFFGFTQSWDRVYGGNEFDMGLSVQQTADSGYVISGVTESFGNGNKDAWLLKTNVLGDTIWSNTFGGSNKDYFLSVKETVDEGFILSGFTKSFGNGDEDMWLVKTNSQGNEEWSKTFGGSYKDYSNEVLQTNDGGYLLVGYTESFGSGQTDVWVVKTNSLGIEEWNKTYGGSGSDIGYSVDQTTDDGFIITGKNSSLGSISGDIWLLKIDEFGVEDWNQSFGGTMPDIGYSVKQTVDGGYILAGMSGGSSGPFGIIIKTDSQGNSTWIKYHGLYGYDYFFSVEQTTDNGYIVVGETSSFGAGSYDVWLLKFNEQGDTVWSKTFGGSEDEYGRCVSQTTDGGFIISGMIKSFDNSNGNLWLIKTDYTGYLTEVVNVSNSESKELSKIVNLFGQETKPTKNTPLLYQYDDGTVEKKIIIE
jgi:hypothetical protein